ncbi:MAG: PIN domain-containing protein [Propionibacteriaceae bacterium]|jgi:predicted nucleic acid-binding protein|nr:PIN domain-containing protein [Propionibacteriaceae bacterium]
MGRRLILDTSLLIEYERGRINGEGLGMKSDDIAIAAITVAEFQEGVLRADTPDRAAARKLFLDTLLAHAKVLDYTASTAAAHAKLLAYTHAAGLTRGAHDLIIAAHAVETGRLIATKDFHAKFADLPQVTSA